MVGDFETSDFRWRYICHLLITRKLCYKYAVWRSSNINFSVKHHINDVACRYRTPNGFGFSVIK